MSTLSVASRVLDKTLQFPGGTPAQFLHGTGTRVNATAGAASSAEAAIPAGGGALIIRATESIWIRFGATGMAAAAADANSILFVGGEAPYVPRVGEAFFRVLRVGTADVPVQLESAGTL